MTSDILIFKKRDRLVKEESDWVHTKQNENGIDMNTYFADHPFNFVKVWCGYFLVKTVKIKQISDTKITCIGDFINYI